MTYRIIARGPKGEMKSFDYDSVEELLRRHIKIGVEDCSTHLELRGLPIFRGLIGPMPDGEGVARYETPEVFEKLTKIWSAPKRKKSRRLVLG